MLLLSPKRLAAIAALVAVASSPLSAQRVEIDKPHQAEPGEITYKITLPLERGDVYMCYGWVRYYQHRYRDGSLEDRDESRRSCMPLHGEYDQRVHRPIFKNLAWGQYVAFVQIFRQTDNLDSPRAVSTTGFRILRNGPE